MEVSWYTYLQVVLEQKPQGARDANIPQFDQQLLVGNTIRCLSEIQVYDVGGSMGLGVVRDQQQGGEKQLETRSTWHEAKLFNKRD